VAVAIESDFPIGAGLGGSSAAGVALAAAIAAWQQRAPSPEQLAEWSRQVEVEQLGIAGGRQDHYAAAYGGALALEFRHDVLVTPIALTTPTISALETRCLVVYTGEARISGDTIQGVLSAYAAGRPEIVFALDRMATLARLMATALEHGDIDSLGALVGEHWIHQRALHPAIATERIDTLIARALSAGALGAKPLGASGGGCVLLIAPENRIDDVRDAADGLGTLLDFRIALQGVRLSR
jgi:D-glycero-alpha-D-manno-heptose-7-phosphate kinase